MKCRLMYVAMACALGMYAAGVAQAAVWIMDPLTAPNPGLYTIDSGSDPVDVVYDAAGAHTGSTIAGDGGRNYIRTIQSNFAQAQAFTAEITFETTANGQEVFFGLGAGQKALFGTPDWSTLLSSASFWPEANNNKITRFRTFNDHNSFGDSGYATFDPGIHRLQMTYSKAAQTLQVQMDLNYAGGPFVADPGTTNFPISVASLFNDNNPAGDNGLGWPEEPSRIFFGGDDGTILRDLEIHCTPEPASCALLLMGVAMMSGRRILGKR